MKTPEEIQQIIKEHDGERELILKEWDSLLKPAGLKIKALDIRIQKGHYASDHTRIEEEALEIRREWDKAVREAHIIIDPKFEALRQRLRGMFTEEEIEYMSRE